MQPPYYSQQIRHNTQAKDEEVKRKVKPGYRLHANNFFLKGNKTYFDW